MTNQPFFASIRPAVRGWLSAGFFLPAGAAFFAWEFVRLVAAYWRYYGIGFNGGNGFALLFYLPGAFFAFLTAGAAAWFLLRFAGVRPLLSALLSMAVMILCAGAGFLLEVRDAAGYPVTVTTPVLTFVMDWLW